MDANANAALSKLVAEFCNEPDIIQGVRFGILITAFIHFSKARPPHIAEMFDLTKLDELTLIRLATMPSAGITLLIDLFRATNYQAQAREVVAASIATDSDSATTTE